MAAAFAAAAMVSLACGCEGSRERPPPAPGCDEDRCGTPSFGATPASGGAPGAGGGAGQEPLSVTGLVVQYMDDTFRQATTFPGSGMVQAFGPSELPAAGAFEGGSFTVSGVEPAAAVWLLVQPDSPDLHFDTWSFVDPRSPQLVAPLLLRSVLEEILAVLSVPVLPLQGTAQVVVGVFDANDAPLAGAVVSAPGAQVVAYAAQGSWSDVEPVTDVTGMVVLGNVAAAPLPGSEIAITLGGTAGGQFTVRVARDAATVITLRAR